MKWLSSRLRALGDAWFKFLIDLSGTRTLVALAIILGVGYAFVRGVQLARSSSDIATLLGAVSNISVAGFGLWLAGKALGRNGQWTSPFSEGASSNRSSQQPVGSSPDLRETEPWDPQSPPPRP